MLKRWRAYTPSPHGLPAPSSRTRYRMDSSSESGCVSSCRNHRVPRAPLPGTGVTRHQGNLEGHLGRRYSSFIAHTGSCVRPKPSQLLGCPSVAGSWQVVASPCWEMALPDIISAILAWALGPIPRRVPRLLLPISSPRTTASRHGKRVRHTEISLRCNFNREPSFEAAVIRSPSGSYAR